MTGIWGDFIDSWDESELGLYQIQIGRLIKSCELRALSFEPRGASTGRALAMRKLNIISAGSHRVSDLRATLLKVVLYLIQFSNVI